MLQLGAIQIRTLPDRYVIPMQMAQRLAESGREWSLTSQYNYEINKMQ